MHNDEEKREGKKWHQMRERWMSGRWLTRSSALLSHICLHWLNAWASLSVDWVVGVGVCVTASPHWYLIKTFFFWEAVLKPLLFLSLCPSPSHTLYIVPLYLLSQSPLFATCCQNLLYQSLFLKSYFPWHMERCPCWAPMKPNAVRVLSDVYLSPTLWHSMTTCYLSCTTFVTGP